MSINNDIKPRFKTCKFTTICLMLKVADLSLFTFLWWIYKMTLYTLVGNKDTVL